MGHNHTHHEHGDEAQKNIVTAFVLNLAFAAIELVGGLWTNSVAILSDALHDFGDSVSLGVAWALQKKSNQGRDTKFSYGYKRFSLLGSVFLSGVLLVSSIFIISEAVGRLFDPQEVHARGMFWLAIAGIVINGAAVLRLKKGHTLNERAVFLHLMEDVLGWVAVLVASVVMMFVNLPVLDPLLSLGITAWVLWNVWHNLRDTFRILLQATPADINTARLTAEILNIKSVSSIHDLHVWSQDGVTHVMTLHAVTAEGTTPEQSQRLIEAIRAIGHRHKIDHVTVEIESPSAPNCEYARDDK
ncbi:MAG: cation diffusion facilitator family transporter [Rikenellaceae bacterium]|jgi:cobalt-zinc-cadmium efflux system protein|nr:cation diffusion facilitator family transporter [Rikenellaceae bacterium]